MEELEGDETGEGDDDDEEDEEGEDEEDEDDEEEEGEEKTKSIKAKQKKEKEEGNEALTLPSSPSSQTKKNMKKKGKREEEDEEVEADIDYIPGMKLSYEMEEGEEEEKEKEVVVKEKMAPSPKKEKKEKEEKKAMEEKEKGKEAPSSDKKKPFPKKESLAKSGSVKEVIDESSDSVPSNVRTVTFKTLNLFSKDLLKTFLVPGTHLFNALSVGDITVALGRSDLKTPAGFTEVEIAAPKLQGRSWKLLSSQMSKDLTLSQICLSDLFSLIEFFEIEEKTGGDTSPPSLSTSTSTSVFSPTSTSTEALHKHFLLLLLLFPRNRALLLTFLRFLSVKYPHLPPSTLFSSPEGKSYRSLKKPSTLIVLSSDGTVSKTVSDLIEEFYCGFFEGHPRVNEWKTDAKMKHRYVFIPSLSSFVVPPRPLALDFIAITIALES